MAVAYQHANDRNQEDDLNHAVEDEEGTANHLVGWKESFRSEISGMWLPTVCGT